MSKQSPRDDTEARRLVEAVAWRTHLTESGVETDEPFEAWLADDPRNGAAWKQVEEPWVFFGEQAATPELIELRREALADARNRGRDRWMRTSLRLLRPRLAIAASILIVAISGFLIWQSKEPDVYRTASGERRVVTLVDGSQIGLDSQSEVSVRYTDRSRDLTLSKGQARFDVTHDVERPFSVIAGGEKVVATGTAFNVDLLGSDVRVTLIEGRVVVLPEKSQSWNHNAPDPGIETQTSARSSASGKDQSERASTGTPLSAEARAARIDSLHRQEDAWSGPPSGSGRGIALVAGEQLRVSPTAPPSIEQVNVERTTAWQNGQLVFENELLSSVVARVNRYAERPIDLADARTSELRISGVFHTGDINGFVSTITNYLPIRADRSADGSIRLSHR